MPSPRSKPSSPRIEQQLDEKREEQSGEEGLLAEVIEGEGDKQKITAKAVKARLKEIGKDPDYADERAALEEYAALARPAGPRPRPAQSRAGRSWKRRSTPNIPSSPRTRSRRSWWMTNGWLHLAAGVQSELDRVSQTLTGRIRQLAERYAHAAAEADR